MKNKIGPYANFFRHFSPDYRKRTNIVILAYHRVFDLSFDPQLLSVTPTHFKEHLKILSEQYRVINLSDLVTDTHPTDEPTVILTFDDGYADNVWNAFPLLKHANLPATIFITAGYIGKKEEFWWDELEKLTLLNSHLPKKILVSFISGEYSFMNTQGNEGIPSQSWNVLSQLKDTSQTRLYKDLHKRIKELPLKERNDVLVSLRKICKFSPVFREGNRCLSIEEIRHLGQSKLIEIGSHGMYHESAGNQDRGKIFEEYRISKEILEKIVGKPISTVSYPYGSLKDIGTLSAGIIRDLGFSCACANYAGIVTKKTDRYLLPRFLVRDWAGEVFAGKLEGWMNGKK